MTDLSKAIRRIAWGYFLIHFNINLGQVDILPDFLGMYLILLGIWEMRHETASTGLLEPFAIFLVGWQLLDWILTIFGVPIDYLVTDLFIAVISMYFHFQLQTDLAVIADRYDTERGGFIRLLRTVYTVLTTVLFLRLLAIGERNLTWEGMTWISTAVVVISLLAAVVLCFQLFGLSRDLAEVEEDEDREETEPYQDGE